jgi:hypothetical protein
MKMSKASFDDRYKKWVARILGLFLLVKVFAENDRTISFSQDPIEIWIALGVAAILIFQDGNVKSGL